MSRPPTDDELALWQRAAEARESAYAPYSNFPVGVALRTTDGEVYLGANIENGAYPLSICAEQATMAHAVFEGRRAFDAVAVAASEDARSCPPCGGCRQVLAEFAPQITVIYRKGGEIVAEQLDELLPGSFELQMEA